MHKRPPSIRQSLRQIEKLLGHEQVQRMTEDVPNALVNNELWIGHEQRASSGSQSKMGVLGGVARIRTLFTGSGKGRY